MGKKKLKKSPAPTRRDETPRWARVTLVVLAVAMLVGIVGGLVLSWVYRDTREWKTNARGERYIEVGSE